MRKNSDFSGNNAKYDFQVQKLKFSPTIKRYASLFFAIGMDDDENEMICLAFIHRIVEALDRYFGNVCELDVIFNFERVHVIVDEILMAGQIQESSLKEIQKVFHYYHQGSTHQNRSVRTPDTGPSGRGWLSVSNMTF